MNNNIIVSKKHDLELPFFSIRNITAPEDKENNRTVLTGKIPISSILDIPTGENVRGYLVDAEGKVRKTMTQFHKAILNTLKNNPQDFSVLNGGIVIVARSYKVDEGKKVLELYKPSIINGSQTQGVIKDFLKELDGTFESLIPNVHVTFELIVTSDDDLIGEISISRNYQNDVLPLSIAGRRGRLDELDEALKKQKPETKLQKSETQLSEDFEKTERVLQVIAALTPAELWMPKVKPDEMPNKTFTYSAKAKCLRLFQEIWGKSKDTSDPEHEDYKKLYEFYLDIVGQAVDLHEEWKSHQGFNGSGLKNGFKRDERGNIIEVPDGVIFPVLSSLSVFAKKTEHGWRIIPPRMFTAKDLINAVKPAFIEMASSNPNVMGKSKACYAQLYQITSLYKRLSE
jgi:AIPR protein